MRVFGQTVPLLQYRGASFDAPIQQCRPPAQEPKVVRIDINWADYWPASQPSDLGIIVNLFGNTVETAKLDRIVSVKIDNVGSTVPIYMQFQDTLDIVTAPPNSSVIMPVMTNAGQIRIYARGLTTGFLPRTSIFVANFMMQANVDPEIQVVFPQMLGSPTIQRANALTPGFGAPALGDQASSGFTFLSSAGPPVTPQFATFLPAVPAGGFYYITAIEIKCSRAAIAWTVAGAHQFNFYGVFEDITTDFTIVPFAVSGFNPDPASVSVFTFDKTLCQLSGYNLRLDATHAYGYKFFLFNESGGGVVNQAAFDFEAYVAYTYSLT